MVSNILDLLTSGVGKELIGPASKLLGESESGVSSAISALLPVVLGGMTQKASTSNGAADLFKMVTGANVDTGILGNIAGALGGGAATSALTSVGSSLLSSLFGGDKVGGLASALASAAGIKPASATSLLGLATPFLFSSIKKLVASQGLDAGGLANLLLGQKGNLAKANIPAGLSSVLGSGWLDKLPTSLAAAAAPAAAAAVRAAPPPPPKSGGLGKWLPWLAALIGAFLLWQWLQPKPAPAPAAAPAAPAAVPAPAPAPAAAPAPAPVVAGLPQSVFFEVGKFDLGDEGKQAIKSAFDAGKDGKVALTGYTDKTGDPAANEELAKNRAKAVKEALIALGMAEANIEMAAPVFITGAAEDRMARRVDIVKSN
jgi:outer membrane protein OmpA-like peptidoglycan-associated protein